MSFDVALFRKTLQSDLGIETPGCPPECLDAGIFAAHRLAERCLRKYQSGDEPPPESCLRAKEKFLLVNRRVSEWSFQPDTMLDTELFNGVKEELRNFWFRSDGSSLVDDWQTVFREGYPGPGASIGAIETDFYSKMYCSTLSATARSHDIWGLVLQADAIGKTFESTHAGRVKIVEHSNTSFVPKNDTIARTICTEPSCNMWLQLGIGRLLSQRLITRYGIDLSCQPDRNRLLAYLGSRDNSFVTIDLESASDSLGLRLLEELLPRQLLSVLSAVRCSETRFPDGERVTLNMISTMGNGYTFPLQTVLFSAVVASVYRSLDIPLVNDGRSAHTFGVFGDDIIVSRRASYRVMRLLKLLGFVVNEDKTFVEGPFRESCGSDCFLGQEVTPVYIKRCDSLQAAFVAINRLMLWSACHGIALPRTIAYLKSIFPIVERCTVPYYEAADAGVLTLSSPMSKGGVFHYTMSCPMKVGLRFSEESVRESRKGGLRRRLIPEAILRLSIGGYIAQGFLSVRQRKVTYRKKRRVTPRWGHIPPEAVSAILRAQGLHQGFIPVQRASEAADYRLASGLLARSLRWNW